MGLWVLTDLAGNRKAVHLRKRNVLQDKIWQLRSGHIHTLLAGRRRDEIIAQMHKYLLHHIDYNLIVFHYEDLFCHLGVHWVEYMEVTYKRRARL